MLVGETPDLLAVDDDGADQMILLEHRYEEQRASAAYVDDGNGHRGAFEVRRQGPSVADVDDLLRPDDLGMGSPRMGAEWLAPPHLGIGRRYVVDCDGTEYAAFIEVQHSELGVAQPYRVRQHGLEHRFKLTRRTRDDA